MIVIILSIRNRDPPGFWWLRPSAARMSPSCALFSRGCCGIHPALRSASAHPASRFGLSPSPSRARATTTAFRAAISSSCFVPLLGSFVVFVDFKPEGILRQRAMTFPLWIGEGHLVSHCKHSSFP